MTVAAAGWWTQHGVHTALVGVPALLLGLFGLAADVRTWWQRDRRPRRPAPTPLLVAAALSAAAAVVHVAVCPEHFHEALVYGVFFALAAGCQLGWATLVATRFGDRLVAAGLVGNALLVLLWTATRTIGVEPIGVLDLLATGCEIGIVAMCALAIRHHVHPWRTSRRSGCAARSSTG